MTDPTEFKFITIGLAANAIAIVDASEKKQRKLNRAVGNILHILERVIGAEAALEIEAAHQPWTDGQDFGIRVGDWFFEPPAMCADDTEDLYLAIFHNDQKSTSHHCSSRATLGGVIVKLLAWRDEMIAHELEKKAREETKELTALTSVSLSPRQKLNLAFNEWADWVEYLAGYDGSSDDGDRQ